MTETSKEMIGAAAEAVQEVARGMLKAAGAAMTRHGPDPNSPAILGAAFCFAIDKINRDIDPSFRRRLLIQLLGLS